MLKKIRTIAASVVLTVMTLLFLDFTGVLHPWFGWLANIQLVPAILAVNVIALIFLVLLTFFFGRIYCSAICPLGIVQDGISNISGRRKGYKDRFRFSKAVSWLRYSIFALFVVALLVGASVIVSLLDPYAGFGRIASDLLAPIYRTGNNILASLSESLNSYVFYSVDVWIKSKVTLIVAVLTVEVVGVLAWLHGRTYCNTICPVGTLLGFISRFSFYKPAFDATKCTECGMCEKGCKASCLDSAHKAIDYSRCVNCFNCIESCKFGAVNFVQAYGKTKESHPEVADGSSGVARRNALTIAWGILAARTLKAQQISLVNLDGGLAELQDKKVPVRKMSVVCPGAKGLDNFTKNCSACQLCVSSCPNNVLRPSSDLATLMQPEMSFERGYCRPECVECSLVCPTNSIQKITPQEKTAISIGHVVWIRDNCVVVRDKLQCNSCQRRCPTEAISLVVDPELDGKLKIPAIDNGKCTGCGACEYYCPARPFSAIFVEGNVRHHTI